MSDQTPVSENAPAAESVQAPPRRRSRAFEYLLVLALMVIVVVAAYFQEPLTAFFKLRLWDRDAPARVVTEFLKAGKSGDQKATEAYLGSKEFKPLTKDGKWQGYFIVSQAGQMNFEFSDLAPAGEAKAAGVEFLTIGNGAAEVTVPDSKGKPTKYRLEMVDGSWKITEILGGHPAR